VKFGRLLAIFRSGGSKRAVFEICNESRNFAELLSVYMSTA